MVDLYDNAAESEKEERFWRRMSYVERNDVLDMLENIQIVGGYTDIRDGLMEFLAQKRREKDSKSP